MRFLVWLAFKHLLSNKKQSLIVISAIALGVLLIIFLPSLNYGFYEELLDKTINTSPHITITRFKEDDTPVLIRSSGPVWEFNKNEIVSKKKYIHGHRKIVEQMRTIEGIQAASPYVLGNGILIKGDKTFNVEYYGILFPEYNDIVDIDYDLVQGNFKKLSPHGIGMGEKLAKKLKVNLNDVVLLRTNQGTMSLRIVAIYNSGFMTKDGSVVYVSLPVGQRLSGLKGQVDGIAVHTASPWIVDDIKEKIIATTGFEAISWKDDNTSLLGEIASFEVMSTIINATIMISVGTGVLGIMVIMVNNKRKQIGMLKALGLVNNKIILLFCMEGIFLSLIGAILGTILSVLCIHYFNTHPIQLSDKYGITEMKGVYKPYVFLQGYILAIMSGLIAAFFPSYSASRIDPVEVLKSS